MSALQQPLAHYVVNPDVNEGVSGGCANGAMSYYWFGNRRIAQREECRDTSPATKTVSYLFTDQLGSTVVVNAGAVSKQRYKPWGEIAGAEERNVLDSIYTFTGQRDVSGKPGVGSGGGSGIRLMDYNARYYWPWLGRFLSPDTIVPEPGDPQSLNRYAYSNNNPLRWVDPSGHSPQYPGCGMGMADCGVDGWFGVSDYDRYIQPERDQTAKAMAVALTRVASEPIDSVMTVRDCITEGCNVPLAAFAIMSPLPGSVSKYLRHIDDNAFRKLLALGARNGDEVKAILGNAGTDTVIRGMVDASGNQILLRAGNSRGGLRHIIGRHLTGELAAQGTSLFDDSLKVGDIVDIVGETVRSGQRSRAANGHWVYRWQHATFGWIRAVINEAGEVVSAYPE